MVFFPLVLLFLYICLTFPSGNVSSASGMMNVEEKPKVEKRCHFIFDYNCRKSLTFFCNFNTIGNRNEYSTITYNYLLNRFMTSTLFSTINMVIVDRFWLIVLPLEKGINNHTKRILVVQFRL